MKNPLSIVIAGSAGVVVLLGYFLDIPILNDFRTLLLSWAMLIAAFATWAGLANLLSVHWKNVSERKPGALYSVVLIAAFAITFLLGIAQSILSPSQAPLQQVVNSIQIPVEASLMAILAVSLAYAAIRLIRRRRDSATIIFLVSVVVFLVLGTGLAAWLDNSALNTFVSVLNRLPGAGARGILLGVALGSLTAGLRILIGADRPYGG